ncbi:MAG: AAA family ATPase [Proteobacteria bacterium]|nr:AAA family ATPase [Pseudomonadota bacterium]MBU1737181.1 AAA family ATPase [Pseudomonadota bacterium]
MPLPCAVNHREVCVELDLKLQEFYQNNLQETSLEGATLKGRCPFCERRGREKAGTIVVFLNAAGYFTGYFRCLSRCVPGGFAPHFARLLALDPELVPGYDPDRAPYIQQVVLPITNINQEIPKFQASITKEISDYFAGIGVGAATLAELKVGFNGRYIVYPYFQQNSCSYVARCVSHKKSGELFWHGDENFSTGGLQIFNLPDIEYCEDGTIFVVEGEENLLCLRELGFPGVAVPNAADLAEIDVARFANVRNVFLVVNNSQESEVAARSFASRLGFKARIFQWPFGQERDFNLARLARTEPGKLSETVTGMIKSARAFSPFGSPKREFRIFREELERQKSAEFQDLKTGLPGFDQALGGVHGINIIGGAPKAGKSTLAMQFATGMAARKVPVIYYDFENGRQKVYQRTIARLGKVPVASFVAGSPEGDEKERVAGAEKELRAILEYFRVVNDRKLSPEIMRRHIDFLRHESRRDDIVIVIDSLHKLPFKDFSERRTGIDAWLREFESIRDEHQAAFLVLSELNRQAEDRYDGVPHMGMFKGSGDIEYTADNALVFLPEWDPVKQSAESERVNSLWLVASREHSPGLVARYRFDYPYWGFLEE